jgi:hypothetical protein
MAISQSKYISITSGVGGAAVVSAKELVARIFSINAKIPSNTVLEFTSLADVGAFFGHSAIEYVFSSKYFGYINNYQNKANKISYFKNDLAGSAPFLYPKKEAAALTAFTSLPSTTTITLNIGGASFTTAALDFTAATTYADIATALQTSIQANTAGGELWTAATVVYNSADKVFVFTAGTIGKSIMYYASDPDNASSLASLLGWDLASSPLLSDGSDVLTSINALLDSSYGISNNYGSFAFLSDSELTTDQIASIGAWTAEKNYSVMYSVEVGDANYVAVQAAVADFDGVVLTYNKYQPDSSMPFVIPMAILASTDYARYNGAVSYDFKQFEGMPVSVDTDTMYNTLNPLKINFYGATQQAGAQIAFYQHGRIQGQELNDINVFANEMWLKDRIFTELMNYQLSVSAWYATLQGKAAGDGLILQIVNNEALFNGVIQSGKSLSNIQINFINSITGDYDAWRKVQSDGYNFSSQIITETIDGVETKTYKYLLVYSKGDIIRFVDGTHTLI